MTAPKAPPGDGSRAPFALLPRPLISRACAVHSAGFSTLAALASFGGNGSAAWPSVATLAAITGRHARTVTRDLRRFVLGGILVAEERPGFTTSYTFTPDTGVTPDKAVTPPLTTPSRTPDKAVTRSYPDPTIEETLLRRSAPAQTPGAGVTGSIETNSLDEAPVKAKRAAKRRSAKPKPSPTPAAAAESARVDSFIGHYRVRLAAVQEVERASVLGADRTALQRWIRGRPDAEVAKAIDALVADTDRFIVARGWRLGDLPGQSNRYLARPTAAPAATVGRKVNLAWADAVAPEVQR